MASIAIDPMLLRSCRDEWLGQEATDDEWEYEYDEHLTDTFYLTLDLTSTTRPSDKTEKQGRKTTSSDSDEAASDVESAESPREEQLMPEEDEIPEEPAVQPSSQEGNEDRRVQIFDLHTMNPIVSYQDHIYRCNWASHIGTELLFTQSTPEIELPALRSTPDYTLLAASSFRLTSQPARLMPRTEPLMREESSLTSATKQQIYIPEGTIPLGPDSLPSRRRQARFLERLMETKAERGEVDEVTVHIISEINKARWRTHLAKKKDQQNQRQQRTTVADEDPASNNAMGREATILEDVELVNEELGTSEGAVPALFDDSGILSHSEGTPEAVEATVPPDVNTAQEIVASSEAAYAQDTPPWRDGPSSPPAPASQDVSLAVSGAAGAASPAASALQEVVLEEPVIMGCVDHGGPDQGIAGADEPTLGRGRGQGRPRGRPRGSGRGSRAYSRTEAVKAQLYR